MPQEARLRRSVQDSRSGFAGVFAQRCLTKRSLEHRNETVRKAPEAPVTRAHNASDPARSVRFGPDRRAKDMPRASLAPRFGRFLGEVRRISLPRTPVNREARKGRAYLGMRELPTYRT